MKNLPNPEENIKPMKMLKTYLEMIVLTHKNVGVGRMILAYFFLIFAFISLLFTIFVPVTSEYKEPGFKESLISRLISGGMMVANFIVYGIIIAWKRIYPAPLLIRIAFVGLVIYINIWLISRVLYMLIREGNLF